MRADSPRSARLFQPLSQPSVRGIGSHRAEPRTRRSRREERKLTLELDRAALERLLEFIEPLEALADEEGLEILLDRLAWDADALGLGDPAVLELGVSSLISGLEGLIAL